MAKYHRVPSCTRSQLWLRPTFQGLDEISVSAKLASFQQIQNSSRYSNLKYTEGDIQWYSTFVHQDRLDKNPWNTSHSFCFKTFFAVFFSAIISIAWIHSELLSAKCPTRVTWEMWSTHYHKRTISGMIELADYPICFFSLFPMRLQSTSHDFTCISHVFLIYLPVINQTWHWKI